MNRWDYYQKLKLLARTERSKFGLQNYKISKTDLRNIYKYYGITIDLKPLSNKIKGAYFNDKHGISVLLNNKIPYDTTIFTLAHELKHHLVDQKHLISFCSELNRNDAIEIGAEIFAAELIFPDEEFTDALLNMNVKKMECTPEDLVRLKHNTSTTLSYSAIAKKAIFNNFGSIDTYKNTKWKKLEEAMFGIPVYKMKLNRSYSM